MLCFVHIYSKPGVNVPGASLVEKLAIILLRKHTNNNFYFVIFRFFSEVNFVLLSLFSVSAANPMKNIIAYPFAKKPDDLHANFRPVAYEVYV